MVKINMKSAVVGDVLSSDVIVGDAVLFEAGTVLVRKSIEILITLGVEIVNVEPRKVKKFKTLKEVYKNVDERFSYVEDNSFMMSLKYLVKDIISNMRLKW